MTRVESVISLASNPDRPAKEWGRPAPSWVGWAWVFCHVISPYHYLRLPLVLDIMKICMDFVPYDAFPSFDVPEIIDEQNS
jgi:hypothetical protein